MIKGMHAMFYTSDPVGLRNFFKDIFNFKSTDVGDGWLIFEVPEADLGCHPAEDSSDDGAASGTPSVSFYCDDIYKSVEELKLKGVQFKGDIEDQGYGLVTHFLAPGGFWIQLYQPKYMK